MGAVDPATVLWPFGRIPGPDRPGAVASNKGAHDAIPSSHARPAPVTRVLVLSSMVAHGHVGLSAALPALQALGITTTGIPTTVLSNHPAWPYVAGTAVSAHQVSAMVRALRSNGWLRGIDAVLTGYLPTPDHVIEAAALIDTVRAESPMARIVVDPVLGDTPKGLYLPEPTAKALRDRLLPLAEVITPNAFELGWLSGAPVETPADLTKAARTLLDRHPQRGMTVIATSAPAMAHRIATVSESASETQRWTVLRQEA